MTSEAWAAIITALGIGTVLRELVVGLTKWLSGGAARERGRNADLVRQRDDAYARWRTEAERADTERARADREARARNRWADHAAAVRRAAIDAGIPPDRLPPHPNT